MNISIKGTNLDLTPAVKQYVDEKIGAMAKYIKGESVECKVELERDRKHQTGLVFRAEVMVHAGGKLMRAEARGEDMYSAIDLVVPKIKEQISKFKNKQTTMQRRGARAAKRKI